MEIIRLVGRGDAEFRDDLVLMLGAALAGIEADLHGHFRLHFALRCALGGDGVLEGKIADILCQDLHAHLRLGAGLLGIRGMFFGHDGSSYIRIDVYLTGERRCLNGASIPIRRCDPARDPAAVPDRGGRGGGHPAAHLRPRNRHR